MSGHYEERVKVEYDSQQRRAPEQKCTMHMNCVLLWSSAVVRSAELRFLFTLRRESRKGGQRCQNEARKQEVEPMHELNGRGAVRA